MLDPTSVLLPYDNNVLFVLVSPCFCIVALALLYCINVRLYVTCDTVMDFMPSLYCASVRCIVDTFRLNDLGIPRFVCLW